MQGTTYRELLDSEGMEVVEVEESEGDSDEENGEVGGGTNAAGGGGQRAISLPGRSTRYDIVRRNRDLDINSIVTNRNTTITTGPVNTVYSAIRDTATNLIEGIQNGQNPTNWGDQLIDAGTEHDEFDLFTDEDKAAITDIGAFFLNFGRRLICRGQCINENGLQGAIVGAGFAGLTMTVLGTPELIKSWKWNFGDDNGEHINEYASTVAAITSAGVVGLITPLAMVQFPLPWLGGLAGATLGGTIVAGTIPCNAKQVCDNLENIQAQFITATTAFGGMSGQFLRLARFGKEAPKLKFGSGLLASGSACAALISGSAWCLVGVGGGVLMYSTSEKIGKAVGRMFGRIEKEKKKKKKEKEREEEESFNRDRLNSNDDINDIAMVESEDEAELGSLESESVTEVDQNGEVTTYI